MREHAADVRIYPDSDSYELRQVLAVHARRQRRKQIVIGRGSDEIMHFLAIAYLQEGDEVIMGDPPFSMYEISTLLMGATPVKVPLRADYAHDLEAMAAAVTPRTKLHLCRQSAQPHRRDEYRGGGRGVAGARARAGAGDPGRSLLSNMSCATIIRMRWTISAPGKMC